MRFLFPLAIGLLVMTCLVGDAQSPPQSKDVPWIVPIPVSPAPEPIPALKYLLLPDIRDLNPGNQIPAFYKCFMEQHNFYQSKEAIEQREKWAIASLSELANEKALVGYGGASTRQADYAARLDTVDWAILTQFKMEGIGLLIPDVQQLRQLAQVLKVKLRGEIARRDFDNAIHTAQTMLALARSFESHPTLIGNLVGMAIATMASDALEEFVQQPGAPNLFWALTDLPNPIISLRNGMAGERLWFNKDLDILGQHEPLSQDEVKRLAALLNRESESEKKMTALAWYQSQSDDATLLKAATERLSKLEFPPDKLAKFSKLQIVMADDFMQHRVFRDDLMKWTNVPLAQIPPNALTGKPPGGLLTNYVPAVIRVKQSHARLQQRIDLLRIEEAIRAFAATNGGKLPASLDQIRLPLPTDPVSLKPYFYELKESIARIHGTVPADRVNDRSFNRILEITIQK